MDESFIELSSFCTNNFCLCSFPENAEHCSVVVQKLMWVGSLEETRKNSIFLVSVFFLVYFFCLRHMYMLYVTPSPLPSTPPFPSQHSLFKCWWMNLVLIIIYQLYKSFLPLVFTDYAGFCPVAVFAEGDVRRFFRRHNEEQQLLCKCVFPSFFLWFNHMLCLTPLPSSTPCPLPPPPHSINPSPFLFRCAWMNLV